MFTTRALSVFEKQKPSIRGEGNRRAEIPTQGPYEQPLTLSELAHSTYVIHYTVVMSDNASYVQSIL